MAFEGEGRGGGVGYEGGKERGEGDMEEVRGYGGGEEGGSRGGREYRGKGYG